MPPLFYWSNFETARHDLNHYRVGIDYHYHQRHYRLFGGASMSELDRDAIRQIVRQEILELLAPYRNSINRLIRDMYGENPDGTLAHNGGLLDLTKRNNVLLWVVIVLSVLNFIALVVVLFMERGGH